MKKSVHDDLFGIKKTIFFPNILHQVMKNLARKGQTNVLIASEHDTRIIKKLPRV